MKLLQCKACHDSVQLADETRHCLCGRSAGREGSDGGSIVVGPARLLVGGPEGWVEGRERVDVLRPIAPLL